MPNRHLNRKRRSKFCTGCGHQSFQLNSNNLCPYCVGAEIIAQTNASRYQRRIVSNPSSESTGKKRYEVSFVTKFGIRAVLKFNHAGEAWGKFNTYQDRSAMGLKLYDTLERKILASHDGSNRI